MASTVPGYEYDIFISYRQKDNKGDKWVSEFVDALKTELESTFKEEIRVYFDINPHDGLMESHEVGDSLKEKLKCLIFIPIISRTYCDPKSFAWEHEFKAFVELASKDKYGLKVKLPGGNVASRVLPVRIYDLNMEDVKLCESVLGGALRGIEFIYKSAGVNRPLRANEDHAQDNLNKTYYRDLINKMSHSIQDIIQGLKTEQTIVTLEGELPLADIRYEVKSDRKWGRGNRSVNISRPKVIYAIIILFVLTAVIIAYPRVFNRDKSGDLKSKEILDKAIRVCDVFSNWNNYNGEVRLLYISAEGSVSDEKIEIRTGDGFYKCTSLNRDQKVVKGIENGKCFREINGNRNPDADLIKAYGLDSANIAIWKEHHYCQLGLLMEYKASGLTLDDEVRVEKFKEHDCYTLTFTFSTNKVKNDYFMGACVIVYIDQANYSMVGYKSTDGRFMNKNVYAVFTGTLKYNEIIIPLCKTYYNSADNSLIGFDLITEAK